MWRFSIVWLRRVSSALLMVFVVALAFVLLAVSYFVNRPHPRNNSSIQSSADRPHLRENTSIQSPAPLPSAPVAEHISRKPAIKAAIKSASITRDQRLCFVAIGQTVYCRPSALKLDEAGTLWLDCDEWSLGNKEGDFSLAVTRERNGWRVERERLVLPKHSEVLVHYWDKYQPVRMKAKGEMITATASVP